MKTELTARKNFVLEQFFIIKKSLPEPNHLANEAQKDYKKSLLVRTEYLKEKNKMKTCIIKSLANNVNINSHYLNNSNCSQNTAIHLTIMTTTTIMINNSIKIMTLILLVTI